MSDWELVKLREVTTKVGSGATPRGGAKSYKSSGIPLIRSMNVHFDGVRDEGLAYLDQDQARALDGVTVQSGDVLLNITGASIGRVAVAPPSLDGARVNQHVCIIRPTEVLDGTFLKLYLNSPSQQALISSEESGATRQALTKEKILNLDVPLPALNEQRRIVAKLEFLQARSRRAREALEAVPPLLEKLRQSILAAAFRGELTKDWRAKNPDVEPASELLKRIRVERRKKWEEIELAKGRAKGKTPRDDGWKAKYRDPDELDATRLPKLPTHWCWTNLHALISAIEAGRSPKAEGHPAGPSECGVLKVSAVTWGIFDYRENKALLPAERIGKTPTVRAGDLLISRANTVALVGAVALVDADHPNLMLSDKTLRLVPATAEIPATFVLYALRTRWVREVFEEDATGTSDSMRNLSQEKILSAPIALAPAAEAAVLATRVDALLRSASRAASSAAELATKTSALDRAILAYACSGRLQRFS